MKRINREIADLAKEQLGGMTLAPTEDNMFLWKGSIPGPEGSPYEGGVFKVDIELMKDYPCVVTFRSCGDVTQPRSPRFSAPKVTFATKCVNPNPS